MLVGLWVWSATKSELMLTALMFLGFIIATYPFLIRLTTAKGWAEK